MLAYIAISLSHDCLTSLYRLMQAGPSGDALEIAVPAGLTRLFKHPVLDWGLMSRTQQNLYAREVSSICVPIFYFFSQTLFFCHPCRSTWLVAAPWEAPRAPTPPCTTEAPLPTTTAGVSRDGSRLMFSSGL